MQMALRTSSETSAHKIPPTNDAQVWESTRTDGCCRCCKIRRDAMFLRDLPCYTSGTAVNCVLGSNRLLVVLIVHAFVLCVPTRADCGHDKPHPMLIAHFPLFARQMFNYVSTCHMLVVCVVCVCVCVCCVCARAYAASCDAWTLCDIDSIMSLCVVCLHVSCVMCTCACVCVCVCARVPSP